MTDTRQGMPAAYWLLIVALLAFAAALVMQCCGCRTYYVYQFGDRPAIVVDAKVDKDISPQVKATVTP